MKQNRSLTSKLTAYGLAAGAATMLGNTASSPAAMNIYDNGGAGWYDASNDWEQDLVTFKMDGTVQLNTDNAYLPGGNTKDANTFSFQERDFYWEGTAEKDATVLNVGANCGYVAGTGGYVWDVGRLGAGYEVGPTLADTRGWSDHGVTSTGGLGGWNFYFAGEWPFGGGGYIGLYADDLAGRHYGWAQINMTAYNAVQLNAFGFSTIPGMTVLTGGGESGPPPMPGDFDSDSDVDADDIDLLCDNLGDPAYDLDGDSDADEDDMAYLIHNLVELQDASVGTEVGDFNLDGLINATDLAIMNPNFGLGTMGYADGNANCDDVINATDLAILAANFGYVDPAAGAVPEPISLVMLALGATGLVARRRRAS